MKLVSIVLPTYNGEQWLRQAIDSVLSQTYTELELICVNDASTDTTGNILAEYAQKDSRVKVITNEANQKLPRSLNIGFAAARGDYFTWTSDDNWYESQAIEKMVDYLEGHPDDGMVVCDFKVIDWAKQKARIKHLQPSAENMIENDEGGACFLYRKSVAQRVGEYDPQKFLVEDWDYWLRLCLIAPIGKIDECLYNYRFHGKSLSSSRKEEIIRATASLREEMLPLFQSAFPNCDFSKAKEEALLADYILFRKKELLPTIQKSVSPRDIFRRLRSRYRDTGDSFYKQEMKKLGIKYFVKSMLIRKRKSCAGCSN